MHLNAEKWKCPRANVHRCICLQVLQKIIIQVKIVGFWLSGLLIKRDTFICLNLFAGWEICVVTGSAKELTMTCQVCPISKPSSFLTLGAEGPRQTIVNSIDMFQTTVSHGLGGGVFRQQQLKSPILKSDHDFSTTFIYFPTACPLPTGTSDAIYCQVFT